MQYCMDSVQDSRVQALKEKVKNIRQERDAMECERDFYYDKLRQLEILCETDEDGQAKNSSIATDTILEIL